jgi:hypothetical protein
MNQSSDGTISPATSRRKSLLGAQDQRGKLAVQSQWWVAGRERVGYERGLMAVEFILGRYVPRAPVK